MHEEPQGLILVDQDREYARKLAEVLRSTGFQVHVARSLHEAGIHADGKAWGFLVVGFGPADSIDVKQLKLLLRGVVDTRIVALLPETLESYAKVLLEHGVHAIVGRELPMGQVARFLTTQAEVRRLESRNYQLEQMLDGRANYENLIGGSLPMRSMYRLLDQIARTDAPVLVSGEEGTERIEVARAIHQKSVRAIQPVVVVDCSLADGDEEAAFLFGPSGEGLYSSGPNPRNSAFARAGKGTLIIHRVECLHEPAQRRLMDFLQRPFYQNETPGSPLPLARILATTGPNLLGRVEAGQFLRELFYRLNILQVRVPPLRERREDIPMLAQHTLRMQSPRASEGSAASRAGLSSDAMLLLFQYDWPGNLDELRQTMTEAAGRNQGPQIEPEALPERFRPARVGKNGKNGNAHHGNGNGNGNGNGHGHGLAVSCNMPLKDAKRQFETEYFRGLLKYTQGNMTMASRCSRVGRPYLYKKIKEYGIEPEQFR